MSRTLASADRLPEPAYLIRRHCLVAETNAGSSHPAFGKCVPTRLLAVREIPPTGAGAELRGRISARHRG